VSLLVLKSYRGIYAVLCGLLVTAALLLWSSASSTGAAVPQPALFASRQYATSGGRFGGGATLTGDVSALAQPTPFTSEYYAAPNERFGVGMSPGITVSVNGTVRQVMITDYDISELHIGWYSDWLTTREPLCPGGIKYAQVILVRAGLYPTNTLELTATVAANPGSLWLIGNEPEGKYGQGNRTPGEYADIYHHLHTLVKGIDPTAWIAIGGVIEPTPLRLQWLDMVLNGYESRFGEAMPVDVWNIHAQILQEKAGSWGAEIPAGLTATEGRLYTLLHNADPDIFRQLVIEFRQWMKDKGFENKPLIISEYGVLMPSDYLADDIPSGEQKVIEFMCSTFDFVVHAADPNLGYPADDNRLVQQWLWYSLNSQPYDPATGRGFNGALFSHLDPTQMTKFGVAFREYMHILLGYPRVLLPVVMRGGSPS